MLRQANISASRNSFSQHEKQCHFLYNYSIISIRIFLSGKSLHRFKGVGTVTLKNKVEVRIAGKDYTLVGVESDEYIQKIALYIDRKMGEITRQYNKLSTSLTAVLTALNVADDYFKVTESEAGLKKEIKRLYEIIEELKQEKRRLAEENMSLNGKNNGLQLELAKREAELKEVRNSVEKYSRR